MKEYLQIHHDDNVLVALQDLPKGLVIQINGNLIELKEPIASKHKFTISNLNKGDQVRMYGVLVGKATSLIESGGLLSTKNIEHASDEFGVKERKLHWIAPDVSKFASKTFMGFHREDGRVGTANYWLVIPMVFCENRNVDILKSALVEKLGYSKSSKY